jgi:hypothetical protein
METNESLQKALMQVAENQMKQFIEKLQNLREGDLKSLEEQVMSTIKTMGCLRMETTLHAKAQEQTPPSQKGLVGTRCDWWECEANDCKR